MERRQEEHLLPHPLWILVGTGVGRQPSAATSLLLLFSLQPTAGIVRVFFSATSPFTRRSPSAPPPADHSPSPPRAQLLAGETGPPFFAFSPRNAAAGPATALLLPAVVDADCHLFSSLVLPRGSTTGMRKKEGGLLLERRQEEHLLPRPLWILVGTGAGRRPSAATSLLLLFSLQPIAGIVRVFFSATSPFTRRSPSAPPPADHSPSPPRAQLLAGETGPPFFAFSPRNAAAGPATALLLPAVVDADCHLFSSLVLPRGSTTGVPAYVPTQCPDLRADPASRPACRPSIPVYVSTQRPGLRADLMSRPTCRLSISACVLVSYPGHVESVVGLKGLNIDTIQQSFISSLMDASSGSGSSPSITQPHTVAVSPSKTSIIHEEVVDIGGKRKKVADVWSHAKKIIRRNDKNEITAVVAICNYCKTEVPAHSKTHGNNGIDGHVKKCKNNPHNAVKSGSSQQILTQSSMNNALTPHIFCQKKLEDKVVAFVVKDEMPFRVVEGAGFVEMMKEAQPRFKIPNRKKIASLVWDLYALEMAKIKSVIGDQRFKKVFGRMAENVQFVEYFEEVDGLEKKKRVGPPMEKDWEKAQVFVNFLKRFHDTTLQLSATKKTTSPLIWEEIVAMRMIIDETILDTTDPSLQEVAKRMESKFIKYWGNLEKVNKLVFLGHILDSRYKLQMIGIHLGDMKLDASKIQFFVDGLKNCLMELYHAYKGNSPLDHINGIDDGDVDKDLMEMYKNDPIKLNYHLKMAQLRKAQKQAEITNEVDKYFSDPFVKWSSSFDILEWWKGNTTTFPVLSKIAKDIFSIPSSTVASENAFSLGRRVVDPFRASLHPKMVEALVCTTDWLRGEEINLYKEPTEDEFNFYKDCEEVVTKFQLKIIRWTVALILLPFFVAASALLAFVPASGLLAAVPDAGGLLAAVPDAGGLLAAVPDATVSAAASADTVVARCSAASLRSMARVSCRCRVACLRLMMAATSPTTDSVGHHESHPFLPSTTGSCPSTAPLLILRPLPHRTPPIGHRRAISMP
ncbi:hypothetical protein ZIOFF_044043 [Zingiber officinale]|uniref:BED-type domain-containing protein n=1 Tax=Zingiber officinale TaxID=94328 RepID=A0A8J5KZF5_ZINOF|nr:hypothetical protein ZIOFF_044043 [Zingiber officinale]